MNRLRQRADTLTEAARWAVEHMTCERTELFCGDRATKYPTQPPEWDEPCNCTNCTAWRKLAAAAGKKT
jgi:hypothetical protein